MGRGGERRLDYSNQNVNPEVTSLPPGPSVRGFVERRPIRDFGALSVSALHSKGTLTSAVCFCTGEAKYFYYLFYYLSYELLLFA